MTVYLFNKKYIFFFKIKQKDSTNFAKVIVLNKY